MTQPFVPVLDTKLVQQTVEQQLRIQVDQLEDEVDTLLEVIGEKLPLEIYRSCLLTHLLNGGQFEDYKITKEDMIRELTFNKGRMEVFEDVDDLIDAFVDLYENQYYLVNGMLCFATHEMFKEKMKEYEEHEQEES